MSDQVRAALSAVVDGKTLTLDQARDAMGSVMDGEATPALLAALLVALRMRGETVDELAGFATAMRDRVTPVDGPPGIVDTCGTGGDGSGTFNISTAAALVVAAAGVPVAKHGNRAMTSKSGSADVLDALGIRIDHDAPSAGVALRELGFAFLFAPTFHPAMKHAGPTRREIGVRTAFNLLGPLTNPAGAKRQLIGVADANAAARIAEVLHRLGTEHALVVHGDGVDELPLDGSGIYYHVTPDGVTRNTLANTWDLNIQPYPTSALAGGTPSENAAHIEGLFYGPSRFGAAREVVVLNAAAGLLVGDAVDTLADGVSLARDTIDAGSVGELIDRLRAERQAAEADRPAAGAPA